MGSVGHIEVGELWIQDAVKRGMLTVKKVKGGDNPADILTKHVDRGMIQQHCNYLRVLSESGRRTQPPPLPADALPAELQQYQEAGSGRVLT